MVWFKVLKSVYRKFDTEFAQLIKKMIVNYF